jgi:hypothetical protein
MPSTENVSVKKLKLDLENFRTVPQENEIGAVQAMISINSSWFWSLMKSLLEDGYHPTENIIVLKTGRRLSTMTVKEGNRRVGALKLILGCLPIDKIEIPDEIREMINTLRAEWVDSNSKVPCVVYENSEADTVDKMITLTHGKGEQAGRDIWTAVARARHNRDKNNASEPGLTLLEKYLDAGRSISPNQAERWAGDYPVTVLDEAIKGLSTRIGAETAADLAEKYPRIKHRSAIDEIVKHIGLKVIRFSTIRDKSADFAVKYGIPTLEIQPAETETEEREQVKPRDQATGNRDAKERQPVRKKAEAQSIGDPKAVKKTLKKFRPCGENREKLVALLIEARSLDLSTYPHAFILLLRSMFEISAKAYCKDHENDGGLSFSEKNGREKYLVDVLKAIYKHLTMDGKDREVTRMLHGANMEMTNPNRILSVTSMNQLVHSTSFSLTPKEICTVFHRIFPLLDAMNR